MKVAALAPPAGTLGQGATLVVLRAAQAGFGLLGVMILSRAMTEADLARALVLVSGMAALAPVAVLGFDAALIRAGGCPRLIAALAGRFALVWLGTVATAAAVTLALGVSTLFAVPVGLLFLWAVLAAAQGFLSATLLSLRRPPAALVFGGALSSLLACTCLAVLVMSGQVSVAGVALAHVAGLGLSLAAGWVQLRRWLPGRWAGAAPSALWSGVARGSLTNALAFGACQLPLWVAAVLGTAAEAVDFALALRLVLPLSFVLVAARSMTAAALSARPSAGSGPAAQAELTRLARFAALATALLALPLVALAEPLMTVLFGRAPAGARLLIAALALGPCLQAAFGPGQLALRVAGEEAGALRLAAALAALQLLALPLAWRSFGLCGLALAASAHMALGAALPAAGFARATGLRLGAFAR